MKRRRPRTHRFIARASRLTFPVIACLLVPFAAAVWAASWSLLRSVGFSWRDSWPVLAGAAAYALFQALFSRPMGLYVFGHELTHAVAAWLSGYRVKSLKVSPGGGEVVTSDTNLFVALAPYCVPVYTVLVVLAWSVGGASRGAVVPPWCAFAVGLTFAFHAALTLHALRQRQPDLDHGGTFLSWVIILLSNGLTLALLLKFLYPEAVSLSSFGRRWWELTRAAAEAGWHALGFAAARLKAGLR